jgi:hypothetical protein
VNPQISMKRINEFKSRHAEMLGPVFQKYQDPD